MKNYDYLVVGSGLLRATFAYRMWNTTERPEAVNPYGDGLACGRIADFLENV